jgi:hypothetical protein
MIGAIFEAKKESPVKMLPRWTAKAEDISMKLSRMALFSMVVLLSSAVCPAQEATGRIVGTVYDQ